MARHHHAPHRDPVEPCRALDDGSERVLRQIVDHAGIGLFATAIDGSFLAINHALVQMLGYDTVEELLADGRSANSFYVDPADQKRVRDQIGQTGVVRGMVYQVKRRDGMPIWVTEHGSAVRDVDGTILSYVGSLDDVTELIETQTKLAEAEANYRRIFECASEGIYRSSLDGHALRTNPALTRLNGYASEEEHLRAVKDIATEWYVDPTRRDAFKRLLEDKGFVENFESEVFRHKTRERIWISENAYLVCDNDGNPLYYEGTVRDITRQKTAEHATLEALKKAEAADRAKTRFLAHMSHELRTPLNAILGFSDMMRSLDPRQLAPEKIKEYADDIHKSGSHLLDLINDVLDLSRIESDAVSISTEPIAPQDLVHEALQTIGPIAQARRIELDAQIDATGPALVDRRAMHQCLLNVLSNAVKFSSEGGRVRLRVEAGTGAVLFTIEDRGIGMPKDRLHRIGRPFYTIENPARPQPTGTGLGLAITRSLIDRMDGGFDIDSELGTGTRVTLSVPAADDDITAAAAI